MEKIEIDTYWTESNGSWRIMRTTDGELVRVEDELTELALAQGCELTEGETVEVYPWEAISLGYMSPYEIYESLGGDADALAELRDQLGDENWQYILDAIEENGLECPNCRSDKTSERNELYYCAKCGFLWGICPYCEEKIAGFECSNECCCYP